MSESIVEKINSKIAINKETLSTMPKNNKKNVKAYLEAINDLRQEYTKYKQEVTKNMLRQYNKLTFVNANYNLKKIQEKIRKIDNLYLLNRYNTSFEKMGLDKKAHSLRCFYKNDLEKINNDILFCINRFKDIGIYLNLNDFNYTNWVQEYLKIFFAEMDRNIKNSDIIKEVFEETYWKCPEIITHIELNIRYIYFKYQKPIDKYFAEQKAELLDGHTEQDILKEYLDLSEELIEETEKDKSVLLNKFLSGELKAKDYSEAILSANYKKIISDEVLQNSTLIQMQEINHNISKLLYTLYEYRNFLKFQFVFEDIKKNYKEKDKFKKVYDDTKKEIDSKEKKLSRIVNSKNGLFKGKNNGERIKTEETNLIIELKNLYKQLDINKAYNKILTELNDNSTIEDALDLASSFYNYLVFCIRNNNKDTTEEQIQDFANELKKFILSPYNTIIGNITILEEKDIPLIIKDRYNLLNITITKENLDINNINKLIAIIENIVISCNLKNAEFDLEELDYICKAKEILNK